VKLKRNGDFDLVLQALQQIRSTYPSAILAGGAIRDLTLGNYVKDYDIFVHKDDKVDSKFHDPYHWEQLAKISKPKQQKAVDSTRMWPSINSRVKRAPSASSVTAQNVGVNSVVKFDLNNDITVDIIITNVAPDLYVREYFDIGICKTYTNGTRVFYTPDFISDVENKTITILGKHMTFEEIERCEADHAERVQEKYPSHTIVKAPHIQRIINSRNTKKSIF